MLVTGMQRQRRGTAPVDQRRAHRENAGRLRAHVVERRGDSARPWWSPCGGKSIPKMGATGFGYDIARQFGLRLTETRPRSGAADAGAEPAGAPRAAGGRRGRCGGGLRQARISPRRCCSPIAACRGPAILQISSYWREGEEIGLDMLPEDRPVRGACARPARKTAGRRCHTALAMHLPKRLAQLIAEDHAATGNLADFSDKALRGVAAIGQGLALQARRLGRLSHRRSDARRRRHPRSRFPHHGGARGAGPLFHRRGGGRHRLARRLQFPMGVVVRLVRRAGCLKANRLFPPPCGEG